MRLSDRSFRRTPALVLILLLSHIAVRPMEAQDSVFQIIALNRLMQVVSDAMLPVSFDVPGQQGAHSLTAQLADVWYCGADQNNTASAVVVIVPSGVTLPKRTATQADCASGTLDSVMSKLTALTPRPATWMAAAFISASYSPGRISLTFVKTRADVAPGSSIPPEIAMILAQTGSPFRTLDTTNVALTVGGKAQNFTLAFLFQPAATTVFGFAQGAPIPPTSAFPGDVSLQNLPKATNCILRIPHVQAKQELSGPLAGLTFPLQAGGQTYTVSNFQIAGSINQYQTVGIISNGGLQLHPTINWAGADLGFQNVRLAEAAVSCGKLDFACKVRKAAAITLQTALSGAAPQGKPLRPVSSKDVNKFQASGKTYTLRLSVLRSSSTNDSLQLPSFISVGAQ